MSQQTTYEVYTLEEQRWILHARFSISERDAALEEAKRIERTLLLATKVVREIYRSGDGSIDEQTIYISDKSLREAPRRRAALAAPGGAAGPGRSAGAAPQGGRSRAAARGPKSMTILLKLVLVIGAALVVASAVTALLSDLLDRYPEYAVQMQPQTISLLMFSAFVLSFLATAVPLSVNLINWQDGGRKRPAPAPAPAEKSGDLLPSSFVPPPADKAAPPPQAAQTAADTLPVIAVENAPSDAPILPYAGIPDLPPQEPAPPPPLATAGEAPPPADEAPPAPPPPADDAQSPPDILDRLRLELMHFLSVLLEIIRPKRPELDAYNKFGVDLIMAGAVDVIGDRHALDRGDKQKILAHTLESMGTRPDPARKFAERYEEYLLEPRYMAMVQSGRAAMEDFMAAGGTPPEGIDKALEAWNRPQAAQQSASHVMTLMFTDMVGSTDLTQSKGDQAAQDLVRRHNTIVRAALAEFSGKEIKHTGDGIMASFASASQGVEAAITIQRAVAAYNLKNPDAALHLRIGMNAGEPIEEEDDLFGSTVQLAARVCAKADTDQILCTNVVRELSSGKTFAFRSIGGYELKGFKQRIELFAVTWL
ncbi:adenylate and guanylate cyclase catalytic domain protein [mine drainage metagenome]|uniref:Adenylate and guanylate cyclase catalytic domain protein n=1 Tax=mine drainage metagenome TaxID=410659 RepID=A0A1J5SNQ8_9ZZZZ